MPRADRAAAGLFAPGSPPWEVNREAILLLAGPRALLLQLAHPLVAAAVADHSRFEREPVVRLRRTLEAMFSMLYGDRAEALATATAINEVHEQVRGELRDPTRAHGRGTPYAALDPALLRWVMATLVDSSRVGYACFVRPLSRAEDEAFIAGANRIASLLRIPESHRFASAAAFDAYLRETIAGPELEVTPTARRLADAVLHPPIRLLPRALGGALSLPGVALLPPEIRERYGLPWDRKRRLAWRAVRATLRGALPLLPGWVRAVPPARRAERSGKAAEGGRAVSRRRA